MQHPTDTRAKIIFLLDAGRDKVNQGIPLIENIDDLYLGKLSDYLPDFMKYLRKLAL